MRTLLLALSFAAGGAFLLVPATRSHAQICADDYSTVDRITGGTILGIVPAPEPFVSTDIYFTGPTNCTPLWMQVLKADAAHCRVGDKIDATGIVTSDGDTNSWNINPSTSDILYMRLGQDYFCTRQTGQS